MYSLGIDIGSSSVKVSLLEIETGIVKSSAQSPKEEMVINASKHGYAEQDPEMWWTELGNAMKKLFSDSKVNKNDIKCIGISYQMHGLVMIDKAGKLIRSAIIWCDSRAVETGDEIAASLGKGECYNKLLNLPGNFTASKLQWVKSNEPENYSQCAKIMLPGDWIAYKMTGEVSTTITGLSEGTLWDFKENKAAGFLLKEMGVPVSMLPSLVPVFGIQGKLNETAASCLGLKSGVPVAYRAGDQPNNAFSLNVIEPGEVAATAGTSGVVYAVTENYDAKSVQGVNAFAHINHNSSSNRLGVLLCINGTGIANSWVKKLAGENVGGYNEMNRLAANIKPGSEGLSFIPFGNGAERMLGNKDLGASIQGVNFNIHNKVHIYRAVQEGIAFSFHYGIQKMQNAGVEVFTLKAGKANLFQSSIFTRTLSAITNSKIMLYDTDGAAGAARGAAFGSGYYTSMKECFSNLSLIEQIEPDASLINPCKEAYGQWKNIVEHQLKNL